MDTLTYPQHYESSSSLPFPLYDNQNQGRRWALWVICALLALAGYVARDYPEWRAKKMATVHTPHSAGTSMTTNTTTVTNSSNDPAPESATEDSNNQSWPSKFSPRWIPFMPFALVYLLAKVAWSFFRWFVLHSLWFIERFGIHLALAIEKTATFAVHQGPNIVRRYIIYPVQSATNFVWQTIVVEWCQPKFEHIVLPAVIHTYSVVEQATIKHYHSLAAIITRWADPAMQMMTWVIIELVYQPITSIASRLAIVGRTFLHTANIYLQELAKDVADLLRFVRWAALWIWNKVLCPLGARLGQFATNLASVLWTAFLKVVLWIYCSFLLPSWNAMRRAIAIIRSHPTLLAGIQALSVKVQAKAAKTLQRIEEVNWLLLLESVLIKLGNFLYYAVTQGLTLMGRALSYFFVEMIPNAYQDLLNAIDFMRPIVEWVVLKVLAVVRPCWQATVWLAKWIASSAGPCFAFLDRTVLAPVVKAWQSYIQPGLTIAIAKTFQMAVASVKAIHQAVPILASVLAPLWKVVVEISDALSRLAAELGRVLLNLTGEFGVKVHKTLQEMAPQFEAAKQYLSHILDDMVVWANDAMVDWVKKEKRD
ncbi:hypothetical protein BGW42_000695 [Actinomortierella wolfii]|nr:hypothetical protein BGW42_000695 [Actinomortierella wolfii]